MRKYVLDTDICIYWLKGNKNIERKILQAGLENICVTVITECELFYGALKSERMEQNIINVKELLSRFETLHTQPGASFIYGEIKSRLEKKGRIIDDADILIASITLQNSRTLVTNNIAHFKRIKDLQIENWA